MLHAKDSSFSAHMDIAYMHKTATRLTLRGGAHENEKMPWDRPPVKPVIQRWEEAGVSLQPDFGPDANLDVPMEQKLGDAAEFGDLDAIQALLKAGQNLFLLLITSHQPQTLLSPY